MSIKDYKPTNNNIVWCPNCGYYIFYNNFLNVLDSIGIGNSELLVVTGIGCSGRVAGYIRTNAYHTIHGRALPFAQGSLDYNPDLKVVVIMGEGDAVSIGGNHFIHACRRNPNLTVYVLNNRVYGMTGGQASPTSEPGLETPTTPYGFQEKPLDIVELACSSGAGYVARTSDAYPTHLRRLLEKGFSYPGMSVIEVRTSCYRHAKDLGITIPDERRLERERTIVMPEYLIQFYQWLLKHGLVRRIPLGVFRNRPPEVKTQLKEVIKDPKEVLEELFVL